MYNFDKAYKQYEDFVEQVKQINEFWVNSVFSSVREFFKIK